MAENNPILCAHKHTYTPGGISWCTYCMPCVHTYIHVHWGRSWPSTGLSCCCCIFVPLHILHDSCCWLRIRPYCTYMHFIYCGANLGDKLCSFFCQMPVGSRLSCLVLYLGRHKRQSIFCSLVDGYGYVSICCCCREDCFHPPCTMYCVLREVQSLQ